MSKKWAVILHWIGFSLLALVCLASADLVYQVILSDKSENDSAIHLPERGFIAPKVIQPKTVASSWNFETIFSPHEIKVPGQGWLAVDSKGRPALAYGGSQLNYAWYDGANWHIEGIDLRPGAGKFAHLLFDANDQPHIVYAFSGFNGLSLETMYRDPQGWHHQVIDPGNCFDGHLDIAFDAHGRLLIAYDFSPSCSLYTSQIRLASETGNGWQIETVSETGISASLVVDSAGRVHVAYQHIMLDSLVDAVRQENGDWPWSVIVKNATNSTAPVLLIDANLRTHVIYGLPNTDLTATNLFHTWMDKTGWHTELIKFIPASTVSFSAFIDSDGQIYALISHNPPTLLRRDNAGWQEAGPKGIETMGAATSTLAFDTKKQLHLAYFVSPQYTVNYAVQKDGQWQTSEVDRGDEPNLNPAALAFDRAGQLHFSFYDTQRVLHYFSKEKNGWRDEVVAHPEIHNLDSPIELLFDLKDQPHIFYQPDPTTITGNSTDLLHAYKDNNVWVNEGVPVKSLDDYPNRSPVVINPEGWPAILESRYSDTLYLFRSPNGWKFQPLPYVEQGLCCAMPQFIFPGGPAQPQSAQIGLLPQVYYYTQKSNAVQFSSPGESKALVAPLLDQHEQFQNIYLLQSHQGFPVFFVSDFKPGLRKNTDFNLRFATNQNGSWQTYQLEGPSDSAGTPLIDSSGSISIVYFTYDQFNASMYYLTGSGADWKNSEISGWPTSQSYEQLLVGTALSADGEFCLVLLDLRRNSLILGCLQSLS